MNLSSESSGSSVTAQAFQQWQQDCQQLENALPSSKLEVEDAIEPASIPEDESEVSGIGGSLEPSPKVRPDFDQIQAQIREALKRIEEDLIQRMDVLELLKDDQLANHIEPSMAMIEKLLHLHNRLDPELLQNAKALIKKFVDQLTEALKLHFKQSSSPKIDPRIPPQKVFRNLDVWKTVWKNLTNWDSESQKLYVARLFFRHTVKKSPPKALILVVDQSGSMIEAMVNAVVMASIFAGIPTYRTRLIAFDTRVVDLTSYIRDPFEALLQTRLGGGTDIHQALSVAYQSVEDPANTLIALISDFEEGGSKDRLLGLITAIIESKTKFLPIGAVTTARYPQVNSWFKQKLKALGTPIFSGTPEKLIDELKRSL
ncbi:VWA domain-containing protein [Leptolyngbya sp. AN10]